MNERPQIIVVIATSHCRNALLFQRALPSVFRQTVNPNAIVIVDDNDDVMVSHEIVSRIESLRKTFPLLHYVRNSRTRHMSGTGAWNTGISFVSERFGNESFIAILDDDDEWLPMHLSTCLDLARDKTVDAVFPWLRRDDCDSVSAFSKKDMRAECFLVGNPGIQGSNMFFRVGSLIRIKGFDEELSSCTDRDLMIRFLLEFGARSVRIARRATVLHHAGPTTVTSDSEAKASGLNRFYMKHLGKFDLATLNRSIERAKRLFSYQNGTIVRNAFLHVVAKRRKQVIAIGVMMHDDATTIKRCLKSIFAQKGVARRIEVVVQDDDSHDNWEAELAEYRCRRNLTIRRVKIGNIAEARTELNRYIAREMPDAALIGRLDADDEFADENALAEIERVYDMSSGADLVLGGNFLRSSDTGRMLKRVNRSDRRLGDRGYLLERLLKMASGIKSAELPSCNLFISPLVIVPYPQFPSAEDHALLVHYLLRIDRYKIAFAEDCLPVVYSLNGRSTMANRRGRVYLKSRMALFKEALSYVGQ